MKKVPFYLIIFVVISCSSKKDNEQLYKDEKVTIKKKKIPDNKKVKEVDPLFLELYFPQSNCIESNLSNPIDTLYKFESSNNDSTIVGLIYLLNKDLLTPSCLDYYRRNNYYESERGANYSLGEKYHHLDTTINAVIYESNGSYDSLFSYRCDCEDASNFEIVAFFEFINSYLIQAYFWESSDVFLINRKNGIKTRLGGNPEFNPSKSMFIATYYNEYGGESIFKIFNVNDFNYELVYSRPYIYANETSNHLTIPDKIIWISDSVFIYRNTISRKNIYAFKIINTP